MQEAIHAPLIIGHRGASAQHPENTLLALREALRAGADGVEFDVREARDGRFVLHHDPAAAHGGLRGHPIEALDLAQLRAGGPADPARSVPELEEALEEAARGAPRAVLVELKAVRSPRRLGMLLARWGEALPLTVMSFDLDLVRRLRAMEVPARCALVSAGAPERPAELLARHHLHGLALRHDGVTAQVAGSLRAAGMALYAWTVNEEADLRRLLPLAPAGIITDDPGRVARQLETIRGAR